MKKNVLTTMALLLTTSVAMAIPAQRGLWKTLRLADGTEVKAELVGDEYGHCYRTADGRCFVLDYNATKGKAEVYKAADMKVLQARADSLRMAASAEIMKRAPKRASIGGDHSEYTGEKKGLIILMQFPDKKFASGHDQALYNRIANEPGFSEGNFKGSVHDYYLAQSGGKFTIKFDVVGPITAKYNYAYYGQDSGNRHDINIGALVKEALLGADDQVNYKDYDWDGDNNVEQVFILYAGEGQATGGGDNTIWPHMSRLGTPLQLDGAFLSTYACSNEMIYTEIAGIGAVCHEFSHCMGLPDMYDTSYGGNFGMNQWDVMDQGSYNGGTFIPANYTAYERMYCGWMQPQELTDGMEVSGMKSLTDNGQTYIMTNTGNSNEYYLFENRSQTGWDAGLPGSGMLVTHVDYSKYIWQINQVNTTSYGYNDHERCTILPANGSKGESASAAHLYPTTTNKNIAKASTPNMSLYKANAKGDKVMELAVLGIKKADDGTISFRVLDNDKIGTENRPANALFYESFDLCSGVGGNDGEWSGTVASFTPDNEGWSGTVRYGAYMCARFGSNTQRGNATTPDINIDGNDQYILQFNAAPYKGEATSLTLSSSNADVTLGETTAKLTSGQWTTYRINISGTGTTKFGFRANKARFFLDEVSVYPASEAGITDISNSPLNKVQRIYTIDGRYAGTSLTALPKGVYIVGGKKVMK